MSSTATHSMTPGRKAATSGRRAKTWMPTAMALALFASACGGSDSGTNQLTDSGATNTSLASTPADSDATNNVELPADVDASSDASATEGAPTPPWWFGCDVDNFVLEGTGAAAVFAALGEPDASSVKLSDNPLGVGLLTDCRASNDMSRVSIIAVPPIGGLLESVDDVANYEETATVQDVVGHRAAVWADAEGMFQSAGVHINVDGFTIEIQYEIRDDRSMSVDELKQHALISAEAFLKQM